MDNLGKPFDMAGQCLTNEASVFGDAIIGWIPGQTRYSHNYYSVIRGNHVIGSFIEKPHDMPRATRLLQLVEMYKPFRVYCEPVDTGFYNMLKNTFGIDVFEIRLTETKKRGCYMDMERSMIDGEIKIFRQNNVNLIAELSTFEKYSKDGGIVYRSNSTHSELVTATALAWQMMKVNRK